MDDRTRDRFAARAAVFKALGHPSRLCIVDELSRGERCVRDLRDLVGADISTVSKHLSVLRNAAIVADEKRGNQVFYRLCVPCVNEFLGCVESVLEARVQQSIDVMR